MSYISSMHHSGDRHRLSIDSRSTRDSKLSTLKPKYMIYESKQRIICPLHMLLYQQTMKHHCLAYVIKKITQLFVVRPADVYFAVSVKDILHWGEIFAVFDP